MSNNLVSSVWPSFTIICLLTIKHVCHARGLCKMVPAIMISLPYNSPMMVVGTKFYLDIHSNFWIFTFLKLKVKLKLGHDLQFQGS